MRCPKCHYLSFKPEPRCKNCGYDLSFGAGDLLAQAADPADETPPDLDLRPTVEGSAEPRNRRTPERQNPGPVSRPAPVTTELPLFVQAMSGPEPEPAEHTPLVKVPYAPRPPLAVRRPTPAPGRVRETYHREPELHQAELLPSDVFEPVAAPVAGPADGIVPSHAARSGRAMTSEEQPAGAGRRIEAAAVDLLFIGAINLAVTWLTLQACELTFGEITLLPILPVAAFLFVLDSGYLLMFTATNGQTIGKMAAGIRVISESPRGADHDRVAFKQAVLRAVLTFPSVLAFGAGFVPALLGRRLALHDRFAHTRVVRA